MIPCAYLRVYRPLDGFPEAERAHWERFIVAGGHPTLARIEGQIAISALLRRLPSLRLASEELEWRQDVSVRGLRALPVVF